MAGGVRDRPYQGPPPAFSQTGLPDDASRGRRRPPVASEGGPCQPGGGHVTARSEPPTAVPGVSCPVGSSTPEKGDGPPSSRLRSLRRRPLAGRGVLTVVGCSRSIGVRSSQAVQMSVPPPISAWGWATQRDLDPGGTRRRRPQVETGLVRTRGVTPIITTPTVWGGICALHPTIR